MISNKLPLRTKKCSAFKDRDVLLIFCEILAQTLPFNTYLTIEQTYAESYISVQVFNTSADLHSHCFH